MSYLSQAVGDPDLMDVFEENNQQQYPSEFIEMLEDSIRVPHEGTTYEGIFELETDSTFNIDCGFKDSVRVPKNKEEKTLFSNYSKGDKVMVFVKSLENKKDYTINGSVAEIYRKQAIEVLQNLKSDEYVSVRVDEMSPGGYNCSILMDVCEIEAFLPQTLAGVNKIPDDKKNNLVGNVYNMCIDGFVKERKTWIVSRRGYLEQLIPHFLEELDKDTIYQGNVTDTTHFGVFVQFLDCLTGLIHKSNLNKEFTNKLKSLKPGDPIEFKVKDVIQKKNRKPKIILTQLDNYTIWDDIKEEQVIEGEIKSHQNFGTLVNLDEETTGLIHKSEVNDGILSKNQKEKIKVKVVNLDEKNRKIYLKPV
jgi:ribosomal protein S1